MATNQESFDVVSRFEIRLLADDCAPDAEAPYVVWKRYEVITTLGKAEASGRYYARRYRMCGFEIYDFPVMDNYKPHLVSSFIGHFGDDDPQEFFGDENERY